MEKSAPERYETLPVADRTTSFSTLLKLVESQHLSEVKNLKSGLADMKGELASLQKKLDSERRSSRQSSGQNSPTRSNSPKCVVTVNGTDKENGEVVPTLSERGKSTVTNHVLHSYLTNKMANHLSEDTPKRFLQLRKSIVACEEWCLTDHSNSIVRRKARALVTSSSFDAVCVTAICLNAVFVGAATQWEAKAGMEDMPIQFEIIARVFSIWFFLELLLRVFAYGPQGFLFSEQWSWNLFDLCIVGSDIVALTIELAVSEEEGKGGVNATTFRVLRMFRLFRALRLLRLVRFFKEFRIMVMSVMRSGPLLFWSGLFLVCLMFVFSIILTQTVVHAEMVSTAASIDLTTLKKRFGSIDQAIYTLFMCITNGISWHEVADPLFNTDIFVGLVFVFYIFFAVFSLLNIITAIFVDTALSNAKQDHDEVIQAQLQDSEAAVKKLAKIFREVDVDKSETISMEELVKHLKNPKVVAYFSSLGIPVYEAETLFELLDADSDGVISVEEFVFGCLRVTGSAKTVDLQMLMRENKQMMTKFSTDHLAMMDEFISTKRMQEVTHARLDALQSNLSHLYEAKTDVAVPVNSTVDTVLGATTDAIVTRNSL